MSLSSNIHNFLANFRADEDKRYIEVLKEFLQSEEKLETKEEKLGEILKGMSGITETIIERTSRFYSMNLVINEKITELNHMDKTLNLEKIYTDSRESLKIFAQANEILKVLVNDHMYTKDKEIIFSKTADNSYKRYIKTMEAFNSMTGGEELERKEYYPIVESIIKHIDEGRTHLEKRDIILQNLAKTLSDILNNSKIRRDKYHNIMARYQELHDASVEPSKEIFNRIIQDLRDIEKALENQIRKLEDVLSGIIKVITLEDNIKKEITEESELMKTRKNSK